MCLAGFARLPGLQAALSAQRVQEEPLPTAKAGLHQQMDLRASHTAAIRAGGLHLACKIGGLHTFERAELSPDRAWVAAHYLHEEATVLICSVTGAQQDLAAQLSAQPPGRTLTLPGNERHVILQLYWSPSSQHLGVLTLEGDAHRGALRVSTFQGTQLVGSFVQPFRATGRVCFWAHLDDAATTFLELHSSHASKVIIGTAQGAMAARHTCAKLTHDTALLSSSRLLAACAAGDRLCIISASCVQEISLLFASAKPAHVLVSSWDGQAAVSLGLWTGSTPVCLVDLQQQGVQRFELSGLAEARGVRRIAQGAHAVAAELVGDHISVVVSSGRDMGKELFRCSGSRPQWDSLGRFLAVAVDDHGVLVLDGASGARLAAWHIPEIVERLLWSPDSCGLVVQTITSSSSSWCVLRFADGVQTDT